MRYSSYLRSAILALDEYDGSVPLQSFLKTFFARDKKFGSTDRRTISQLCYCYFRLGKAATELSKEERILLALFLCSTVSHPVLQALKPEWDLHIGATVTEKMTLAHTGFNIESIFPWAGELSAGISHDTFSRSFLVQPKFFIRIRPGKEKRVKEKLLSAGIAFEELRSDALALPQGASLDKYLKLDEEAVVQDYSSQRVGDFFPGIAPGDTVWDCCSGSGGKSILAYDRQPRLQLAVSDKRESIMANLRRRFRDAGINSYKAMVTDLEKRLDPGIAKMFSAPPSLVIADVPCSGSGTWSRTPEQLYYYQPETTLAYQRTQTRILQNVLPVLSKGSHLLYITCSVFKKENEEVVERMVQHDGLKCIHQSMIVGYEQGADSLFTALLISE